MTNLSSLHKKAQQAIRRAVEGSEQVLVAQPGEKAALVATDRRVLICKWGLTSGAVFGSQLNSWDLAHITGVEYRTGMTTRAVVIQTAGAQLVTKFGRMDGGPYSVWRRPTRCSSKAETATRRCPPFANWSRTATGVGASPSAPPVEDADQICRFAALRDDGILTEDEFQAKKRAILGL